MLTAADRRSTFVKRMTRGRKKMRAELHDWLRTVVTSGAWAFFPVIAAIVIGYVFDASGIAPREMKKINEPIAIVLMGLTVLVFIIRVRCYALRTDIPLLFLSIGFLCREIHFTGTDVGVVVVALTAGLYAWWWRDDILDELAGKNQLKAAIFCMCWSYLITLLIQRRVFKSSRIALLPYEAHIHINLEEITENIAHLAFLLVGLIAFYYPSKANGPRHPHRRDA